MGEEGISNLPACRRCLDPVKTIWCHPAIRRAVLLGLGLMALNQLSGINTVMYYSTTILEHSGFSKESAIWLAALCCFAQLCGGFISVYSMDHSGRRKTALRSVVGVIVCLGALPMSFFASPPEAGEPNEVTKW